MWAIFEEKRRASLVFVLLLSAVVSRVYADPERVYLDGIWQVRAARDVLEGVEQIASPTFVPAGWHTAHVPATVLAILTENGVYPDPYYGTNLKKIPGYKDGLWLAMPQDSPFRTAWWYRTTFEVPNDFQGKHVSLHLEGINFAADVWLNGHLVGSADKIRGMFRRHAVQVTEYLRWGAANVLLLRVVPPGQLPEKDYDTKQIEATTGWDDHNPQPPDLNTGVWQPVYLEADGPVSLLHPYVQTDLDVPDLRQAVLTPSIWVRNNTSEPLEATVSYDIDNRQGSQTVTLGAAEQREVIFRVDAFPNLRIDNPRVWWPNPVGRQELYTATFAVRVRGEASDTASCRFGIRKVETFLNEEKWRHYRINGRDILIRGGAWMTCDMMLRLTRERYEALVRYAREANLNMLRSEGFSIRETDLFYDVCDEYGVMVTQQLFGRSIPDEDLAVACVEDTLLRIRNHPSLVHFLGHDETFPTDTLDAAYRRLIEVHRLDRTYQPHSGTFNVLTRESTGGTRTGTRELWTYAGPSHYYWRKFDGAWGFAQSGGIGGVLAARASLREMMAPEDWSNPLQSEAFSFHTVVQGITYFDALFRAMERSYGPAEGFDDFCNKIYAMNYNSARGMFEAYARNKYAATGITTWKYDAAWPASLTWQYIDWYLRPTAAYFGAKKACSPLHVLYAYDDNTAYVVNSFYSAKKGLLVSADIFDATGQKRWEKTKTLDVAPDGREAAFPVEVPADITNVYFLRLALKDAEGAMVDENVYWLSTTPDIPGSHSYGIDGVFKTHPKSIADFTLLNHLDRVDLSVETGVATDVPEPTFWVTLKNTSNRVGFLVQLALVDEETGVEIAPVYWEDNYLCLVPESERTIKVNLPVGKTLPKKLVLDVSGWNVNPVRVSLSPSR